MLVAAAEEERFTRKKHDSSFPAGAIDFCLKQAGITSDDLDYVVFYEKPYLKLERILLNSLGTYPSSPGVFSESMITWFGEKLWIKSQLLDKLRIPADKLLFVEHHMSHAASAMFTAPFDEAAIMTIDGVGEWTTTTIGRGTSDWDGSGESKIELLAEQQYPHSLGLLYSAFTAYLGFRVNNGEYKVMGMSPFGDPNYMDDVYKVVRVEDDGSFNLDMDYFSFHQSLNHTFNRKFEKLFGPRRKPESEFFTPRTHPGQNGPEALKNQKYADISASIQRATEDIILKIANHVHELTGLKKLVMAGGVALNSVVNGRIVREGPFDEVYIQPAAGDSGGALGAALYAYHVLLGKPRKFVMEHTYYGQGWDTGQIRAFLDKQNIPYEYVDDMEVLTDRVVESIINGEVVGWYRDRFEWGPRALGNRSILADPRRSEMKDIVNAKIKFREPFRPFAPVIIQERAGEYFEMDQPDKQHLARFMLMVAKIPEDKQEQIPAVTHVNGSGRLQAIHKEFNAPYHSVVKKFGEATGVPVVLNTSFNLRGEPIVTTPAHAFRTFHASGMELLAIDHFLVKKEDLDTAVGSRDFITELD
jgi:carbamoyltransferase